MEKAMLIGKDWKIGSDSLNLILYRRRVSKKSGKERWSIAGYYSSIKNALEALADNAILETDLKDLKTIVKKQDEIYQLIKKLRNY